MDDLIRRSVETLEAARVDLRTGLTHGELASIEKEFGFRFNPDHAALLAEALPTGKGWVDWRRDKRAAIRSRLQWPTDGVLFDVENNDFWPASWGIKPAELTAALEAARTRMEAVPTLVPVFSHRYLPAAPAPSMSLVVSVYQTDVVFYGDNLLDYIAHEFNQRPRHPTPRRKIPRIKFWSRLAEGVSAEAL